MSRITGTDAANLIEAYNSLYAPQEEVELTEEQVQEDFENWVNSLVEEGHDLSEYTWEDMYEHYLNEAPIRYSTGPTAADLQRQRAQASPKPAAKPLPTGNFQQTRSTGRASSETRNLYRSSSDNKVYRNYNDALAARNSRMNSLRGAQDMLKGRTPAPLGQTPAERARPLPGTPGAATPRPAAAARPAAPARPATTTPARPAAQPTTAARPTPVATPAKPASTATIGFQLARQGVDLSKPSASPAASPAVKPARPSLAAQAAELRQMQAASRQRQGLSQSFDIFDIVKGYLIDEGYAETEEAAAVIMANMSDEWRQSIVEEEQKKATWDKGQKLKDPRAQKIYDRMTGPNPVKLPPA